MASLTELAQQYVEQARRNPSQSSQILRRAAAHFADMAADPANKRARESLTSIGLDFAGAAMQQSQQEAEPTTNDFTQLLRDTSQALNELGPDAAFTSHTAMDTLAQRRVNDTEDAQHMSVQPRTFLNRDTTLGRTSKIKFNPTDDERLQGIKPSETVAFWQGRKQESQAMSVDFGLALPPPLDLPGTLKPAARPVIDSRLYAKVQYGADGNTQNEAILDLRLGQRITVVGNYISVLVGMDPPRTYGAVIDEQIGVSVPLITAGASIGSFAAPTLAPVTRTIIIDDLGADTASDVLVIPQRAVNLLPPLAASPTATLTIDFLDFNGNTIGRWQSINSPNTPFWSPFPIPADAYYISVTTSQSVPTDPFTASGRNGIRIPFELSL